MVWRSSQGVGRRAGHRWPYGGGGAEPSGGAHGVVVAVIALYRAVIGAYRFGGDYAAETY